MKQWLEHWLVGRSEVLMHQVGGPGAQVDIASVQVDLFRGNLSWRGIEITAGASDSVPTSASITGRVGSIEVSGLSVFSLLLRHRVSVDALRMHDADLLFRLRSDTVQRERTEQKTSFAAFFEADSLVLTDVRMGLFRSSGRDTTRMSIGPGDVRSAGLAVDLSNGIGQGGVRLVGAEMEWDALEGRWGQVYAVRTGRITMADGGRTLRVITPMLTPRIPVERFPKVERFEKDLFNVQADSILFRDLDLGRLLFGKVFQARLLKIAGPELIVHRDKHMPDPPFIFKPLPARALRELPLRLQLDTVLLDAGAVSYFERGEEMADFGEVRFDTLDVIITGTCTSDPHRQDTMHVRASALAFEKARIDLDVRLPLEDPDDRIFVHATSTSLPFRAFDRATNDLLGVRADRGVILGVRYDMVGDDDGATGTVDMEYTDLALEVRRTDGRREARKLLTLLVNGVVRKENRRASEKDFRLGTFRIDRRKDRAVFNYLWLGLREGMLATMLPGAIYAPLREVR
ncbi:MAG: hypothetical protein H6595_03475 [Flavobacteriales bacterium]|nr:hypothetical protein [Flavobacteriales bacterium]MCB9166519.1 hypothetical protein [Flavobacteriales bacterium]